MIADGAYASLSGHQAWSAWALAGPTRSALSRLLGLPVLGPLASAMLDADVLPGAQSLPSVVALTALVALLALAVRTVVRTASSPDAARRVLRALQVGGTPSSVAFIMDGNRRWARARGRPAYDGHPRGGEKLAETLQWCLDAGIRTVTVYAFSIENFKRPQREIDEIFALAYEKITLMLEKADDVVQTHRVRVNILGDLNLLPPHLQRVFARAMRDTRHFMGGPTLNICFAYTARAEMARAVSAAVGLCDNGRIIPEDIDEHLIASCLYTGYASGAHDSIHVQNHPELLVRTSGETRLSDFLLLQCGHSVISFQSVLWPDLTAWDMVRIILDYQAQSHPRFSSDRQCSRNSTSWMSLPSQGLSSRLVQNVDNLNRRKRHALGTAREDYFNYVDKIASA
jgi:ditrans,polycis-polyprenyl diphosphate synthase